MNDQVNWSGRLSHAMGRWVLSGGDDDEMLPDVTFLSSVTPFLPGIMGGPQTYRLDAKIDNVAGVATVASAVWLENEPFTGLVFERSGDVRGSPMVAQWCTALPTIGELSELDAGTGIFTLAGSAGRNRVEGPPLEVLSTILKEIHHDGRVELYSDISVPCEGVSELNEIVVIVGRIAWHFCA